MCEVVTFEHERVDLGLVQYLEEAGAVIRPGATTLRAAMDKTHQRRILLNRGFNVPPFSVLRGPDDMLDFAEMFGWPMVIKSIRSGGQADRGAWVVDNQSDALRVMAEQVGRDLMIEAFQPIVKELVVLVARRPGGNARCYPVAETVNADGACREIRIPAAIGSRIATEAMETAKRIAAELDAVGVIAVEFFLTTDGLVVNEIAARPHNAGHHTIENAPTSQFENHVTGHSGPAARSHSRPRQGLRHRERHRWNRNRGPRRPPRRSPGGRRRPRASLWQTTPTGQETRPCHRPRR